MTVRTPFSLWNLSNSFLNLGTPSSSSSPVFIVPRLATLRRDLRLTMLLGLGERDALRTLAGTARCAFEGLKRWKLGLRLVAGGKGWLGLRRYRVGFAADGAPLALADSTDDEDASAGSGVCCNRHVKIV